MAKIGNYQVNTDILYYDNYTWCERISDTELRIGLTDYGQQTLKDITNIQLPSKGARLQKNAVLYTIESIAKDMDIKSPASCIVTLLNDELIDEPDKLNEDPFGTWIVVVECVQLKDLDLLIDGEDMADLILEETAVVEDQEEDKEDSFDYESEFSIDSGDDDYYNEKNTSKSSFDEDYIYEEEDW